MTGGVTTLGAQIPSRDQGQHQRAFYAQIVTAVGDGFGQPQFPDLVDFSLVRRARLSASRFLCELEREHTPLPYKRQLHGRLT